MRDYYRTQLQWIKWITFSPWRFQSNEISTINAAVSQSQTTKPYETHQTQFIFIWNLFKKKTKTEPTEDITNKQKNERVSCRKHKYGTNHDHSSIVQHRPKQQTGRSQYVLIIEIKNKNKKTKISFFSSSFRNGFSKNITFKLNTSENQSTAGWAVHRANAVRTRKTQASRRWPMFSLDGFDELRKRRDK